MKLTLSIELGSSPTSAEIKKLVKTAREIERLRKPLAKVSAPEPRGPLSLDRGADPSPVSRRDRSGVNVPPVPPGEYAVVIEDSGLKRALDGDGMDLALNLSIRSGPQAGRRTWVRLNLVCNDQEAKTTSLSCLADILKAAGLREISHTDQLLHHQFTARLDVNPGTEEYCASNVLKGVGSSRWRREGAAA